jgi:hypothetical protein
LMKWRKLKTLCTDTAAFDMPYLSCSKDFRKVGSSVI